MSSGSDSWAGGLTDRELACLYLALGAYLLTDEAHHWFRMEGLDKLQDRPDAALLEPGVGEENALYRMGHGLDLECERRGRSLIAEHLPPSFSWPFSSWERFCIEISRAYDERRLRDALATPRSGPAAQAPQPTVMPFDKVKKTANGAGNG